MSNVSQGDGEMAQEVRALTLQQKIRICFPAPMSDISQPPVTQVLGDPNPLFWTPSNIITNKIIFCKYDSETLPSILFLPNMFLGSRACI